MIRLTNLLTAVAISMLLTTNVHAAYCSLRDPVGTINALFPDHTNYRSIVKVVGENERTLVNAELPPNVLHFSELGQHTLYVVYQKSKHVGYVHVRSEESRWGLVEVAWALNTNLEVKDYRFQRCRSRDRTQLETVSFRKQLQGRSYSQLKQLLSEDHFSLNKNKISIPSGADDLASALIRSGLKTLLITATVWREDIADINQRMNLLSSFNSDHRAEVNTQNERYNTNLEHALPNQQRLMNTKTQRIFSVSDNSGNLLGHVYQNNVSLGGMNSLLEWHIDNDNKIIQISSYPTWTDQRTREDFEQTMGQVFDVTKNCSDRPSLLTKQAVVSLAVAQSTSE